MIQQIKYEPADIDLKLDPPKRKEKYFHGEHNQEDHGNWATGEVEELSSDRIQKLYGKEIANAVQEWQSKATPNEIAVTREYGRMDYAGINHCLRDPDACTKDALKSIPILESAINKSKLWSDLTVYRGLSIPVDDDPFEPGVTFKDNGFISASLYKNIASKFFNTNRDFVGRPALIEIKAKKGTKGLFASHLARDDGRQKEGEVIFQKGTSLRVIGTTEKNGVKHIQAEIIDD